MNIVFFILGGGPACLADKPVRFCIIRQLADDERKVCVDPETSSG
jgi:hypothetical protein